MSVIATRTNAAVYVALVYMAWLITTPQYSDRFRILGEIQFEKVLAGAFIVVALLAGDVSNLVRPIPAILGALFVWMHLSFEASQFRYLESAIYWHDDYWKKLVFFCCLTISIRSRHQLKLLVVGVAAIIFAYQLYSWFDFLNGGSFVFQQGMKRMKGVWEDVGYGAGNAWGFLGLFGLPFAVACYRLSERRWQRLLSIAFCGTTAFSIVFSGTRGAMAAGAAYMAAVFRKRLFHIAYLLAGIFLLIGIVAVLPDEVTHRIGSIVGTSNGDPDDPFERIAEESVSSRLQGLIDGFSLANEFPVFGCGPRASAYARNTLERGENERVSNPDYELQLHNLYGQVVGELGYVGLLIWGLLIVTCSAQIWQLRQRTIADNIEHKAVVVFCDLCLGLLAVLLIYGMAGHTLYDYRWLFVFGLVNSICALQTSPD